jgi:glycosyltransferase involved in cell wall biosynthesis
MLPCLAKTACFARRVRRRTFESLQMEYHLYTMQGQGKDERWNVHAWYGDRCRDCRIDRAAFHTKTSTRSHQAMRRVFSDKSKTLLSVIIPAYNVEPFIEASLESALQQPRADEIELIVVDDGSSDRTLDRILAVQATERGRHIKVIHQENRGVSAARNAAIAQATSPYLGFLDSDDVWATNFSDTIMPLLDAAVADIIEFNVAIVDGKGRVIDEVELIDPASVGPRVGGPEALMQFARVCQAFPAARVYRRELWDGIQFPAGRVYEDCSAIPLVYTKARTLHRLSEQLYFYRRRAGSITQNATPHTVKSLAICAEEALAHCDASVTDPYWIAIFHKMFSYACLQASKVNTSAFAESLKIIEATAARYRAFTEQRKEPLPPLRFHMRIFADRRVFRTKSMIKRLLGLELRPPSPAPRPVKPTPGLQGNPPAGNQ